MSTLLRTPLFENVKAAGARFVPFGGWEMPVQFQGIQAEHDHVRTAAGEEVLNDRAAYTLRRKP